MKKNGNILAVLAIFFMLISNGAVTAALQSIMEAFPEASTSSVYLILSLPTVFMMVASYISGILTAKKVKYKPLAVTSIALLTVAGISPYFLNSVSAILISRAVFGIAVGMIYPMGNTLAVLYFGPEKGGEVIGYGNSSMNLGCVILQMLGGILCSISWRNTFLVYIIGVLPLLITAVFMKEPEKTSHMSSGELPKVKLPMSVYLLGVLLMIGQMLVYPIYLNLSTIVLTSIPNGTTSMAGVALSLVSVAGMVIGIFFSKIYEKLGRFTMVIGFLLGAVGLWLTGETTTMIGILLGCVLTGVNNTMLMVGVMAEVGMHVKSESMSQASGTAMAFCSLAPILATLYATAVNEIPSVDPIRFIFLVGAVGEFILAAIWLIWHREK